MSVSFANLTIRTILITSALVALVGVSTLIALPEPASAHNETAASETHFGVAPADLEATIMTLSIKVAITAAIIIALITIFSLIIVEPSASLKRVLFWIMILATVLPTIFFAGSTVYLNVISETGGPVHWHLDYRIFVCGEEVQLAGPVGLLSNKVGTPSFHHHDDNRIHVEGTVVDMTHIELEDFFETIGGELTDTSFTLPLDEGSRTVTNGEQCADGTIGTWNAYLIEMPDPDGTIAQVGPLHDFPHYLMKPEAYVPPGDCVIFEFGKPADAPAEACTFYAIEFEKGALKLMQAAGDSM